MGLFYIFNTLYFYKHKYTTINKYRTHPKKGCFHTMHKNLFNLLKELTIKDFFNSPNPFLPFIENETLLPKYQYYYVQTILGLTFLLPNK